MTGWLKVVSLSAAIMLPALVVAQEKKLTMSGIVSDAESRNPVEGARVTAVGNLATSDATTDTEGSFILTFGREVAEGATITIRVEKSGYKTYEKHVAVSSSIPIPIPLSAIKGTPSVSRSTVEKSAVRVSPIDELSKLGWTIQPGAGTSVQFFDNYKHISIRQSAKYFCAVDRPFSVNIVGAKTLDGLDGLRNAKRLIGFDLTAAEINDLSELRYLQNLQIFVMGQTAGHISDLGPLRELKNLKELGLDSAAIHDLTPIHELTNIVKLSIGGTQVTDLSPIRNFHHLQSLNLGGAPVTDLSPLEGIDTLIEMQMVGREVASLPTLLRKDNLRSLSIFESQPVDLSPVGQFSSLETLDLHIYGPQGFDISHIRKLAKLTKLAISGDGFQYISPIRGLDAIDELRHLTKLSLFGVQMIDLAFVADLRNLEEISITNAPTLSNISALGRIKSLKSVSLTGTSVVDISPLLDLPELKSLDIMRTPARSDVLTELERRGVKIQR